MIYCLCKNILYFLIVGDIFLFELQKMNKATLNTIHTIIDLPFSEEESLYLVGAIEFVNFLENTKTTRNNRATSRKSNGHYVSYIYRKDFSSWQVMDDLKENIHTVENDTEIAPALIVYIKNKKDMSTS